MLVTLSGPVPVFRIESVRLAVALTPTLPKERFPERPIMRLWTPVPLAAMVEVPDVASEVTVMLPVTGLSVVGRNETVTFRVVLAAIVPLKLPLKPGGYEMPVTLRGPVPVFEIESVRLAV